MKKMFLSLAWLLCSMTGMAQGTNLRPMLAKGKTWYYGYHHFEEKESLTGNESYEEMYNETTWEVSYTLKGDTTINGRQYMKMYRWDEKTDSEKYYGAFREDEKGRVWQYDYEGDQKDFMLCDITCSSYPGSKEMTIPDVINIGGKLLHRYRWNSLIGVEGVGFNGKGLVHYPFEPEPDCICDYESFAFVVGDFYFSANDFNAPKYIELTNDEKQLVEQTNDFAFRLFRKARTEESKVLSPLSVTYALGMMNNGAAGKTQEEIYKVLGFNNVEEQNAFCLKMINELAVAGSVDYTTKAHISNTIFVNQGQGWQLHPDFTHTVNQYYYAYPSARDFYDGKTRDAINQWASDHTEGVIKEVLSEEDFNPDAVSYLLNAIYFKGMWSVPFKAKDTKEEPFANGDSVPMMYRKDAMLMYAENDLCQSVQLPYGNGTYQLQVFLPRKGKTLEELLESLHAKNWQMNVRAYEVDLKLPRFETETNQNLKMVMAELGMPTAFSPTDADFSHLCVNNHMGNIYIYLMKQVAKIKLDEQGTEAAAVTIIGDITTGIPPQATFHATRPFFYTISEQSTGLILFMGQYMGKTLTSIATPIAGQTVGDDRIYNLSGQRLSAPPSRGLFIQGGKKRVR